MSLKLGAHLSIAGGVHKAVERAESAGCDALQVFTKSNSQWRARALSTEETEAFRDGIARRGLPVVAHASYLINIGSPDDALWSKSRDALETELLRCEALGIPGLVLHPGSHVGSGIDAATARIARAIDEIHAQHPDLTSRILLENTAGQGTNLGHQFEELAGIFAKLDAPDRVGVCIDTAHTFAAGYDISSAQGWDETWNALDREVGLDKVAAIHINDSKTPAGSRVDRHAEIGMGEMSLVTFLLLMNDARFAGRPGILETPKTDKGHEDEQNLAVLRALVGRKRTPSAADVARWRRSALDEAKGAAKPRVTTRRSVSRKPSAGA